MTTGTILLVDDEPAVTRALARMLEGDPDVRVLTAQSADAARKVLAEFPVHVVVTDQCMPGEDGVALLAHVRRDYPEAVRILLTGQAKLTEITQAVKMGRIDRFITKPWDDASLKRELFESMQEAFRRREQAAMRRWLERMHEDAQRPGPLPVDLVRTAVDEESGIAFAVGFMQLANSRLAAHCRRVAEMSRSFAAQLGMNVASQTLLFRAGLLHDIGRLYEDSNGNVAAGQELPLHCVEGASLVSVLPPLARVVPWVRSHHEHFDGTGFPDGLAGTSIPLGARLLCVVDGFDNACAAGELSAEEGWRALADGAGTIYDPFLVRQFIDFLPVLSWPGTRPR